jgi:nucleotide-binding universal stress UspA family protein
VTGIYAASLAKQFNAKLTLLHVSKDEPDSSLASRLRARLGEGEVPFAHELVIERGDPVEQILKVANARNVNLIVMGARRGPFSSHTMHTAYAVLCAAHCPVFTVSVEEHS